MPWSTKTKIAQPDWAGKTKIAQEGKDEEIQTPIGEQILLGPTETDVYLYAEGFSNWDLKAKIEP